MHSKAYELFEFLSSSTKIILGIIILFFLFLIITSYIFLRIFYHKCVDLKKRCTVKTSGTVEKYTLGSYGGEGSGIHLPVLRYTVNGVRYNVTGPKYKAYKIMVKRSLIGENRLIECYEKDGVLYVTRESNSFVGIYQNPMRNLYPIGSKLDVYYSPENPSVSYVLRYYDKRNLHDGILMCLRILSIIEVLMIIFFLFILLI